MFVSDGQRKRERERLENVMTGKAARQARYRSRTKSCRRLPHPHSPHCPRALHALHDRLHGGARPPPPSAQPDVHD